MTDLTDFIKAQVENVNGVYQAAFNEGKKFTLDYEFLVLVQDIAHQLRVMDNDNTDDDRRERMKLINDLVSRADAMVGTSQGND